MSVDNEAILVRFDLALLQIDLLVEPCEDVGVVEAPLLVVDPSMNQHFVPTTDQESHMSFSWRG